MSGTKIGGQKARNTNYERHGADFYKNIGKLGGKAGTTGGFNSDVIGEDGLTGRERAFYAGAKGGRLSRRGWKLVKKMEGRYFYLATDDSGRMMELTEEDLNNE